MKFNRLLPLSAACRILRFVAVSGFVLIGLAANANAALMFSFDYSQDTPGGGFLAPNTGAARRDALVTAGNLFSNLFGKYFSGTAVLAFSATSSDDLNAAGVASAGSQGINAPGFGNGKVIRHEINNGVDLNAADTDGVQLDPYAPVDFAGEQLDFFSVLGRELTHALGWGNAIHAAGASGAHSGRQPRRFCRFSVYPHQEASHA